MTGGDPIHYAVRATCPVALDGVETLLMVFAPENTDRLDQHRAFVDSARPAGVRHVVDTSFYGAAADATSTLARDHAVTEAHLRAAELDVTFLRDNLYLDSTDALTRRGRRDPGTGRDGRVAAAGPTSPGSPRRYCGTRLHIAGSPTT